MPAGPDPTTATVSGAPPARTRGAGSTGASLEVGGSFTPAGRGG